MLIAILVFIVYASRSPILKGRLNTVVATITMPFMAKQVEGKSVPISFRLSQSEADELDAAAKSQSVPVDRAVMVAFIVRKWLSEQLPPAKGKR